MTGRAILCLALLILASPVGADFKDDYEAGLAAAERGDWPEVEQRMRSAIADRPESSGRLLGLGLKRYLPHYYLGLALSMNGQCRAAIAAFDAESRQDVIAKAKENEVLVERRAACAGLVEEIAALAEKLRGPLDASGSQLNEIAKLSRSPELQRTWVQQLGEDQKLAADELRSVRASIERAEQELDRAALQQATGRLTTLGADLERLLAAATARRDEVRARAEGQLQEIDKLVSAARADLRFVSYLEPFPPALEDARRQLEARLAEAARAGVGDSEEELEELRKRVLADLTTLRRAVKSPPDALREVAVAFFHADYDRALELLEGTPFSEPRAAAQACLLRSAALHGVARRAGGTAKLLERVRQQVRSCLASTPVVEPPAGFFPPSFVALFVDEKAAVVAELAAATAKPAPPPAGE